MPSSVLASVALGGILAAALLGSAFNRQTLVAVLVAAAIPDLDAIAALAVPGAHNALLHTLLIPLTAAALLYYDTSVRKCSWVRERYDWKGVRTAWVALAAYTFAIGLDMCNIEGANVLYPLHDQFYSIVGRAEITNKQGFVQTYVRVNGDGFPPIKPGYARGATGEYRPAPPLVAAKDGGFVPVVHSGWQFLLLVTSAAVLTARLRLGTAGNPAPEATDHAFPED